MQVTTVNLLNAAVLIAAGLFGYFGVTTAAGTHAPTALIPAIFGVVLLILNQFWAKKPKMIAHIVVVLTILLLGICLSRFMKMGEWDTKKYIFAACILSNLVATFFFIKSFVDARKQ